MRRSLPPLRLAGASLRSLLALGAGRGTAPGAAGEPQHGIAMHGEPALPAGLRPPALRQSGRAEGRPPDAGRARHLRQPQPVHRQGPRAVADPRLRGREPAGARLRRAVHALRPAGAHGRDRRRRAATSPSRSIPAAHFSDGKPVTADDVIFSWQLLRDKGRPNFRTYYVKVAKAEALSERVVRFDLAGANDRELPLILGLMPVLAKHAVDPGHVRGDHVRSHRSAAAPMWSARSIPAAASRSSAIPNYWGRDLADQSRLLELRRGPLRLLPRRQFAFRGLQEGPLRRARRDTIPDAGRPPTTFRRCATAASSRRRSRPACRRACSGFVFNTRRPVFADIRVREAIGLLFDFEWLNHNFFFDRYQRTASYFEGSELSARGRPADARERALLAPFPDAVRADVMDGTWQPPVDRRLGPRPRHAQARARAAAKPPATSSSAPCCASARRGGRSPSRSWSPPRTRSGWRSPSRAISSAPASRLRVRVVDAVQYDRRRITYDFDMIEIPLGPVAVARQRAGLLLGLGGRRRSTARATTWASRARRSTP